MRITILWALFLVTALPIGAQSHQTYFPSANLSWKNLKTDYGAVGDGITDDTEAFRAAVKTYLNPYNSAIAIFIPNGTYLVSDSIRFLEGYYDCCLTLQGEDRDRTVIQLKDNAPGFQDPENPRAIFYTRAGNQAFGNYVFNLSINTGSENPGAVGMDYITSNYGAMRDINIRSEDGSGFCGVQMERSWPGPGLLKNVAVDGFQYGIRVGTCEYSMTFEDITLRNQTVAGITNACNTIIVRHLNSSNAVPAVKNESGRVIILDSQLEDGDDSHFGIEVSGYSFVFARNIQSSGYQGALSVDGTGIQGQNISEYHNQPDYSIAPNNGKSLGLPIEETPEYVNNNPNDWASVTEFGAQPTNPQYGFFDATDAVQAAFNSGKKCVYFGQSGDNNTAYCIYKDIIVPPTVELISGFNLGKLNFFNGSKMIVNNNAALPLSIERIKGIVLENNSMRTIVIRSTESCTYNNTAANTMGKVFLEDWVNRFEPQFPVQLWARHFNTEVQPENEVNIDNPGGKYWILGLKTEGRANIVRTTNGGATEVLGGLIYPASSFSGTDQAAFTVNNACLSTVGLTMTTYVGNGWYGTAVSETSNGVTQVLPSDSIWSNSPYNFSFFRSGGVCDFTTAADDISNPLSTEDPIYKVFPNPASDMFQLTATAPWEKAVLKNSLGQTVRVYTFGETLRLSGLSPGVFFLEVYGKMPGERVVLRVIVSAL